MTISIIFCKFGKLIFYFRENSKAKNFTMEADTFFGKGGKISEIKRSILSFEV